MEIVREIAVKQLSERRSAILARLSAMGVEWQLQKADDITNIRVPLKTGNARLVIGAHYDNVPGSTGANDNASSCSILLRLIEALKDTAEGLEFVFFDGEESGRTGSQAYVRETGNISAMVNLDVCGHGEVILLEDNGYVGDSRFYHVTDPAVLEAHSVMQTAYMPTGDHESFLNAHIPTVCLCTLSTQDAELFKKIGRQGGTGTYADGLQLTHSDILSTMHHGRNDSIAAVSQEMLNRVKAYLLAGLQ